MLGGELHNSSTSSLDYMQPIWPKLASLNLNTALSAVSWELIEPEEGKFDFTLVDAMLKGARESNLHLVLLWFGSWKNGLSHYAPYWVKKDFNRFPRVKLSNGKATETITPLSTEGLKADSHAFAMLMKHLREVDSQDHTVIMIQVQNEVGVIGDFRDHSTVANAAFNKPVPKELMNDLQKNKNELQPALKKLWADAGSKTSGTWQDIFGKSNSADEAFMAWNYAQYINAVAKAGKAEYPLPMFVNAWIVQPEDKGPVIIPVVALNLMCMISGEQVRQTLIFLHPIFIFLILQVSLQCIIIHGIHYLFLNHLLILQVQQMLFMQLVITTQSVIRLLVLITGWP